MNKIKLLEIPSLQFFLGLRLKLTGGATGSVSIVQIPFME